MSAALITGASTGIGYELAIYHASMGGDLIVVARSESKLEALKTLVTTKFNVECTIIPMDLTVENAGKIIMDEISSQGLEVDYLINNAGVGFNESFHEGDITTWQQMIQLNITSLTDLTYYFIQEKKEKKQKGKILNVASTAAFQGIPYFAVYAATKAYVLSFTEGIAEELKGTGITATALCPGPTKSNFGVGANIDGLISNSIIFASASSVAKYGYEKMLDGEVTAIPGVANRLGNTATQFIGRRTATRITGQIFKIIKQ